MRILLANTYMANYTGAEMYYYELAREFRRRGHRVTIMAKYLGDVAERCVRLGCRIAYIAENGIEEYDIIHTSQQLPTGVAIMANDKTPCVVSFHGQFKCEDYFQHPNIMRYICVRKRLEEKLNSEGIGNTTTIYNPVDFSRFNLDGVRDDGNILFVGTIDELRQPALQWLLDRDRMILIIGRRCSEQLDRLDRKNIEWVDGQIWNIEQYVKRCSFTAGILRGRTTIEGWLCGKPGMVWEYDMECKVLEPTLMGVPKDGLERWDSRVVADQVMEVYEKAISDYAHKGKS